VHWTNRARCQGADVRVFFPEGDRLEVINKTNDAKRICASCPVRKECLDMALALKVKSDEWGIFGGTTPAERREIRRGRMADRTA
jgi:WhiB family redox-sensing transcriptional regulator